MIRVAVIIPYFQRQQGILRRALNSIVAQKLPHSVHITVIVVDDGSPVSAKSEIEGLPFPPFITLQLLTQDNAGVVVARNTALAAVKQDTDYIAFLDSDDSWLEGHLAQALEALESGNDLYFCDNAREGHHASHFASDTALILPYIEQSPSDIIKLTKHEMTTLVLRNFPCQISTTMYRRAIAPELLFDTSIKSAGEDVLFFLQLISRMQHICFSKNTMVHCGSGVNLYFANLSWDAAGYLKRLIDNMKAHQLIQNKIELTPDNLQWNANYIADHRRKIAFHTLRRFIKNKGKWPSEVTALARQDSSFWGWFTLNTIQVVVGRLLGLYRPK
jgi:succinoglycan biosynthesis protein ExoW